MSWKWITTEAGYPSLVRLDDVKEANKYTDNRVKELEEELEQLKTEIQKISATRSP